MGFFNIEFGKWIRERTQGYFVERDDSAIIPLARVIAALPPPPKRLNP